MIDVLRKIHGGLWRLLSQYRLWRDYYIYQHRLPKLKEKIFAKEKIKVVFFPINIGMWKNDYLFQQILKHTRFEP